MSSLVQSSEASGGKGGTLDLSLTSPTSGNLLVICACTDFMTLDSITDSFTQTDSESAGTSLAKCWYKISDGTESTVTITFGSGGAAWGWYGEFNGPNAYQSSAFNSGTGTSATAGTDGDASTTMDVVFWFSNSPGGVFVSATPAGYTLDDNGSGGPSYGVSYDPDRGASNTPGITFTDASTAWGGIHMTFETAAAGPAIPVFYNHHRQQQQRQRGF